MPPSVTAPIRMPNSEAAPMTPCSAEPRWNSSENSGSATPVMNTTKPSKNFPAAASDQINHCMPVIGTDGTLVPSGHCGRSSIQPCTVCRRGVEAVLTRSSMVPARPSMPGAT